VKGWRKQLVAKHGRQAQRAEAHARPLEKLAPRQKMILQPGGVFLLVFVILIHTVILIDMTPGANFRFRLISDIVAEQCQKAFL
jgi:hypothetical protein